MRQCIHYVYTINIKTGLSDRHNRSDWPYIILIRFRIHSSPISTVFHGKYGHAIGVSILSITTIFPGSIPPRHWWRGIGSLPVNSSEEYKSHPTHENVFGVGPVMVSSILFNGVVLFRCIPFHYFVFIIVIRIAGNNSSPAMALVFLRNHTRRDRVYFPVGIDRINPYVRSECRGMLDFNHNDEMRIIRHISTVVQLCSFFDDSGVAVAKIDFF